MHEADKKCLKEPYTHIEYFVDCCIKYLKKNLGSIFY